MTILNIEGTSTFAIDGKQLEMLQAIAEREGVTTEEALRRLLAEHAERVKP